MVPITPVDPLGSGVAGTVLEAWKTAMLALWNAGLWLLGIVLQLVDGLLTPDLSESGPAGAAYRVTFWFAAGLVVIMLLIQLGVGLVRRDGRGLATALWGCGKFIVVWAAWIGYGAAVVSACGGLTRTLLRELLRVDRWAEWRPQLILGAEQVIDVTVATVLGLLGVLLWVSALAHLVMMMGRAATLLVLAAVTPVTAAGLVGDAGRAWFWRSLRWFHAAALTPVLTALLLGVGVQITTGTAQGLAEGPARAVGTALPGVMLILVSSLAPLALFRLLAFVDPATPAGVTLRQGLAAVHDLRSLAQLRPPQLGRPDEPDTVTPAADAGEIDRYAIAEGSLADAGTPNGTAPPQSAAPDPATASPSVIASAGGNGGPTPASSAQASTPPASAPPASTGAAGTGAAQPSVSSDPLRDPGDTTQDPPPASSGATPSTAAGSGGTSLTRTATSGTTAAAPAGSPGASTAGAAATVPVVPV